MSDSSVRVRSASDIPWADLQLVFATPGDPRTCWCQYFKLPGAAFDATDVEELAASLRGQVRRADPTPGLVTYVDDEPAGWVSVEPRIDFPRLLRSRVLGGASRDDRDDPSVWSIPCFVVRTAFRRRGVSGALLAAAVEHARSGGARVVEGYPVDVEERPDVSVATLYHGTRTTFERAGFTERARPLPARPVMTLTLE
jgi:GNAT superfamily N-acetyltransferase